MLRVRLRNLPQAQLMPRPPDIIRPIRIDTTLPEDLWAWLRLHLWSEAEDRVPQGALKKLIVQLLREYRAKVEAKP